jgi:hypothetical protein
MKIIKLTKERIALVDDEDYDRLIKHGWVCQIGRNGDEYARAYINLKGVLMHRFILNPPRNMEIDHINGNGLDNRKCNLRICTHCSNMMNYKKPSHNTSGYKGVTWDKQRNMWRVYCRKNGKRYYGKFNKDLEEAHLEYIKLSKKIHGEFSSSR